MKHRPASTRLNPMTQHYPDIRFFIDGQWTLGSPAVTAFQDIVNPANESVLGRLPVANAAVTSAAIAAAHAAQKAWRDTPPARRAEVVQRASQLLRERVPIIAALSSLEMGTPVKDTRNYALRAADFVEWDAGEARRLYGYVTPSEPGLRQMVLPEPVGPVAAFAPWNAPVLTPCRKIGSALAAGCTVVIKAAEETPACAMAVVQAFADAGAAPGTVNLLFGDPAQISEQLIAAPQMRMVTFTGSVPIGKHLAQLAAREMKPVLMELGGHAPVLICEDADIEQAVARCAPAKFRNGGQACIAPTRFFIHASVYDRFVSAFVHAAKALRVGDPFAENVDIGPLANPRRLNAIDALVRDAVERGARALCGGHRIGQSGYFYAPTVLADIPPDARVLREEPFGPVACLIRYTSEDEAVAQANALPYGLAGYVFTRDAARADRLSRALECGAVAINHTVVSTSGIPFGGVKESGHGREGGALGVRSYTVDKTITHSHI
jgi:succinate-semialdehyde dehydrogenase/glutarate-semialdehyde dehydrogenase